MEIVGEILKKNRESKNITLLDVSKELKISKEILSNIENNYFQNDIDSVFVIGHLRSYCSFLNLNEIDLIDKFKKENFPKQKTNMEIVRPKLEYNLLFSNKLLSLSIIIVVFGTFYFLFVEVDKQSKEFAMIPDLPENFITIVEKANLNEVSLKKNNKITNTDNFAELETNSNSSSAIASLPKFKGDKSPIVTLKFLDDTWVQLRDENNNIIFSQLMNKNDEYSYDLFNNYSITSGNAGHVLVLIDKKVKGKIGKKGQVVDSLIINNNFNN